MEKNRKTGRGNMGKEKIDTWGKNYRENKGGLSAKRQQNEEESKDWKAFKTEVLSRLVFISR